MSALLRVSLLLQVVSCQGLLHIHVAPAPGQVIAGCLEETVATCVVRGAGPPVEISWRTGGLPYTAELQTTQENGTMTIRSELKMIPNNGIYGLRVTCVIVQNLGVNEEQFEKTIALQNIHCK
ncbi:hypothetical protein GDO81_024401 [Engystomops pustulosus]|uniref:Ig-like domain-containing protein n=1 Tax=Engystomops pustulosus TaxID=76066 RepID=A0AAV6ZBA0_ENGPU|nr:hypothetical protein GDO81_024401 [Engystomops pustulosus]